MEGVEQKIYEVLAGCSGMEAGDIKESDHLVEDLGLDSIEMVELGLDLEDVLNIEIPDASIRSNFTVGELVEAVRQIKQPI